MKISEILREWYKKNKRILPWRNTKDPYLIWLSEVILQQTRVNQGLSYYNRFIATYPRVELLAAAREQEVMKLWQGLGYYSRARNLHAAAKQVVSEWGGRLPGDYNSLLKLRGIGEYTAAAIASIAFGQPVAVVDGNVARVISRLFAVEEPVNSAKGQKLLTTLADDLLDTDDPGTHNQAMMELGALVCLPIRPLCADCPIRLQCLAFQKGMTGHFPVKIRKTPVRERFFTYFVITKGQYTYIYKRKENDIWKNLFEFPLVESEVLPEEEQLGEMILQEAGAERHQLTVTRISPVIKHQLTHQTIFSRFVHMQAEPEWKPRNRSWQRVPLSGLGEYPLPRLTDRYLEQAGEWLAGRAGKP